MRKWITQHDVLTKLLSIVAAFILWGATLWGRKIQNARWNIKILPYS